MTAFVAAVVAAALAAAMFGIAPAVADKSNDDLQCPVNHCVNGADLAFGDTNNLAEDASFERSPAALLPASPSWPARGAESAPQWSVISEPYGNRLCFSGVRCATRAGNGTASTAALTNAVSVEASPGDTFAVEGYLKALNAPTGTGGVELTWYSVVTGARPAILRTDVVATAPTTAWTKRRVAAVAPANTSYMTAAFIVRDHSAGSWYADSMRLERQVGTDDLNLASTDHRYAVVAGPGLVEGYNADLTHRNFSVDFTTAQKRVKGTCAPSQSVIAVNFDGTVACGGSRGFFYREPSDRGLASTWATVGRLTALPPGSYAVSAKAEVRDSQPGVTPSITVYCRLGADDGSDGTFDDVDRAAFVGNETIQTSLSLQLTDTLKAPSSSVRMDCYSPNSADRVSDVRITAVRLAGADSFNS